jgi:hypothetical protein
MIRHPTVAPKEINIVLKIYLERGTHVEVIDANRSIKFWKVGLIT